MSARPELTSGLRSQNILERPEVTANPLLVDGLRRRLDPAALRRT
jgi:hypothetical protein